MDERQFLLTYTKIKFQENSSDYYSMAATKRRNMMLNFYGSIFFKENIYVTEFLLTEDLVEYSKVVDNKDPEKVNNYADHVLSLLPNYQNDECKNWKSNLQHLHLKDLLDHLSCSNEIFCKSDGQFMSEGLKELKQALNQSEEEEEEGEVNSLKECKPSNLIFKRSRSFESHFSQHKPVKQAGNLKSNCESSQISSTIEESNKEEVPKSDGFVSFRTARDELQIQNTKKFGRGSSTNLDKNHSYGIVKKSLGTRNKGGVFSKFQPPIRSKENKDDLYSSTTSMEIDEIVDERLKNIDPAMIELIKNEIMDCGSKITWNDIAGLNLAKSTIQEIVVWPMLRPDIFTGLRRPPKGILLFGPPGTGKTLIGKCIASQSKSTFFSISASSLTSKWVGDGEKMVRALFAVAKVHQPSVVFIDEIDSLLSQRSETEHESSRRIKTEFLVQLDGAGTGDEDRILIIGATNRPQELDEAARRRLVKRLYIPLPDEDARKQIIENLIASEGHCLSSSDINQIAKLTEGYSGADVKNLCQEASLGPIRSISPSMIQSINPKDVRPLNAEDFKSALCRIKSSVSEKDLDIYVLWDKQYGCGSASS